MGPQIPAEAPVTGHGLNPYAPERVYYGDEMQANYRRYVAQNPSRKADSRAGRGEPKTPDLRSSKYLINVEPSLRELLATEDTNRNLQLTIEDIGPKDLKIHDLKSLEAGYDDVNITGTYPLSNLLQELILAKDSGKQEIVLDEARITEDPVSRLSRRIKDAFWDGLTRRIDGSVIEKVGLDEKDWTADPRPRIYVPLNVPEQYNYYNQVAKERPEVRLDVQWLPQELTVENMKALNSKPGLLAVAMERYTDEKTGKQGLRGLPYTVPGGRFNEFFGWDSYMMSLGLLLSDKVDLAKSMVLNFCFCIKHYGRILNATRSYFLGRSQPPFLTDMALRVYEEIKDQEGARDFLREAILSAAKEYLSFWQSKDRLDKATGLSRYRPISLGIPQETEPKHFEHTLRPYYTKHNMTLEQFISAYNGGSIKDADLDNYLLHDCGVRESGHDTSYRLEGVCADLATIDLNSLLYKYETDIAHAIKTVFGDELEMPEAYCAGDMKPHIMTSKEWEARAATRKAAIDKYLWNEEKGIYYDYNCRTQKQTTHFAATTLWGLWSGVASPAQAAKLVKSALPQLEMYWGLASGTKECRELNGPSRQWDYPFGWPPHQILAWTGLLRYGFVDDAKRLAYKWLSMMTKSFRDYNGVVVEKYNVEDRATPHIVDAEYGNQGLQFEGVVREGFGWTNASYLCGLQVIDASMQEALKSCTLYENLEEAPVQNGVAT